MQSTRMEIGHTYEESRREQTSLHEQLSLQEGTPRKNVLEDSTGRTIEVIQDGQFDGCYRQK